ncbi:MAG: hypothetical protein H7318_17525 [Oligoflexus sp.]|nr:hypothetical protein [Oligoflexus sp.]
MANLGSILTLTSLLAYSLACSEAPARYPSSIVKSKTTANAEAEQQSHPPLSNEDMKKNLEDRGNPEPTAPAKQGEPRVVTPSPPITKTAEAINLDALNTGKLMSLYTIPAGKKLGWGTSSVNRIKVKIAVDEQGAILAPKPSGDETQVAGNKDEALDAKFPGITTLHSVLKVCNESGSSTILHASNGGPVNHGNLNSPIASGICVQYLVVRAVAQDGATYEHNGGNNPMNFIYLQIEKIGPDGKVVL